ncbi:MAG: group II truncated hemoglobin [Rhodoferax sp.]|uniref:group II truncated hemoglobin n=1 Tax=Rhodoferax sp. TaxID=50421 RepID=UPI00261BC42F|nr:group II truncated hemoglobin [Rhodoferax sp.]MDD2880664.1 group II truncated hemoglobin [Rhodoferax sp.]
MNSTTAMAPYEVLGGEAGIKRLVHRFYELMDELPEAYGVRQMHPATLDGSGQSLFEFLSGWLGGPPLYMEKKGHPRLRMRHAPYAVSQTMRDEWMLCMTQAITEQVPDAAFQSWLIGTFTQMADHMVNTDSSQDCQHGMSTAANIGSSA